MAKAATAKRPPRQKDAKALIAFPVQLGNKRTSDKTISIGATIQEANCTPTRAKEFLCYRRMTATLKIGTAAAKDATGQRKLPGLENVDREIRAVIETNGVNMKEESYGITLNFNLKELGSEDALKGFAKKPGLLEIETIDELTDDDDGPEEDMAAEEEGD